MKLVLSERADRDIVEIASYTFDKCGPEQAERYTHGLSGFFADMCDRDSTGISTRGLLGP